MQRTHDGHQGKQPVVLLLGPTASGKTGAALRLALRHEIEIISVDSALVYRGMDVGTAKPSVQERQICPHHLIDVIEADEVYNAAQFAKDAQRLIDEVHSRGKLPVLVGGTMLYAKALLEPLTTLPEAQPEVRQNIEAQALLRGWTALHEDLAQIDPQAARRIPVGDTQRIGRALEVFLSTGKTLSAHWADDVGRVDDFKQRYAVLQYALMPEPRQVLHARIAARLQVMLAAGFLDEVRGLMARGDLHPEMPSMRCVGYRQAWQHLSGGLDFAHFVEAAEAATRQLAKRQMTWLRGWSDCTVVTDPCSEVLDQVLLQALAPYSR